MSQNFGQKITNHSGISLKFPCDQCEYKAARKDYLIFHVESKHQGLKHPCDQCDYKATYKSSLLIHKKSIGQKKNRSLKKQTIKLFKKKEKLKLKIIHYIQSVIPLNIMNL